MRRHLICSGKLTHDLLGQDGEDLHEVLLVCVLAPPTLTVVADDVAVVTVFAVVVVVAA